MKSILVAILFVAVASAQVDNLNFIERHRRQAPESSTCESKVTECCKEGTKCDFDCSALILDSEKRYNDFVLFANEHLVRSYEYLFLSAQFGTHSKDRPGFEKILHGLSDAAWNKGIEMIKETTERGVSFAFKDVKTDRSDKGKAVTAHGDLNELEALAKAAEIEKKLLIEANNVHRRHSHATLVDGKAVDYDAGLAHYLEEEIIEGKTETVRNLVGHVNDLKNIFKKDSSIFSMALYLFDQQLQK